MRKLTTLILLTLLALPFIAAGQSQTMNETYQVKPLEQSKPWINIAVVQMQISQEHWQSGKDPVDAFMPYIQRAQNDAVDLLVFPEYLLGNFKLGDPLMQKLCKAAKDHNVNLLAGGWEFLDPHPMSAPPVPGTFANSIVVVSREGKIVARHHKMHAAIGAHSPYCWPQEPYEIGEGLMVPGTPTVADLDFGRIGVLTCYDGYFWPSFELPSLMGAEVLVWVNSRAGMIEEHICKAASFMTATHVVASNQSVGSGSQIVEYPGNTVAIEKEIKEAYIFGAVHLGRLREQRRNDRMFHQRRLDLNAMLAKPYEPWTAYPDIPFFEYPEEIRENNKKNWPDHFPEPKNK